MRRIYRKVAIFLYFILACNLFFTQDSFSRSHFILAEQTSVDVSYSLKKGSLTQDYEIIITNKGDVIISEYNYFDKLDGKPIIKNGKLPEMQLKEFKEFIIDSDVFQLENEYIVSTKTIEDDNERLKFTIDGHVKDIVMSVTTVPPRLRQIIKKIEEIKSQVK
ncbi:MAG: hypothetical protein Q8O30_11790 [Candidatus Omnitrophota bacterium]|nr:hypothetical protein [Candidatus Omnitrophota bacterium]